MTTCKRPNCHRTPIHGGRGLCKLHAYASGLFKPTQDARPVIEHINALLGQGATLHSINRAAGLGHSTAHSIHEGRRWVSADTARKILALTINDATPGWVDAKGTRRRLQALRAAGWQNTELSRELGVGGRLIRKVSQHHAACVKPETAEKVAAGFERLGPQVRRPADKWAKAARWPLPAEWDDIDHDLLPAPHDSGSQRPWVYVTAEIKNAAREVLQRRDGSIPGPELRRVVVPNLKTIEYRSAHRIMSAHRNIKPSTERKAAA